SDTLRPTSATTEIGMPGGSGTDSGGTVPGRHVTDGHAPRTSVGQQAPFSSKIVKTVLCRHYVAKGRCLMNDRCSFAHGEAELFRLAHIDPSYKTKNCRNYHVKGQCPRDAWRCDYIHYETPEQLEALRACKSFLEAGIGKLRRSRL
ncbi:CBN-CCCH-1 protein, partial [Aphelenchoides avenae]